MDTFEAYVRVRARIADVLAAADADAMQRVVPACPDWCVRDLVAHVVALPAALGSGRLPGEDLQGWLDTLVAERSGQSVADLLRDWYALDATLAVLLNGMAGLLYDDLAVHEHDLRGALAMADHAALDVTFALPRATVALSTPLQTAGLPPLAVRDGDQLWQSHEGVPGWTIVAPAWEALRAVSSRRTAEELLALPAIGSAEPYLAVLDAHLPLPARSLGEA